MGIVVHDEPVLLICVVDFRHFRKFLLLSSSNYHLPALVVHNVIGASEIDVIASSSSACLG